MFPMTDIFVFPVPGGPIPGRHFGQCVTNSRHPAVLVSCRVWLHGEICRKMRLEEEVMVDQESLDRHREGGPEVEEPVSVQPEDEDLNLEVFQW